MPPHAGPHVEEGMELPRLQACRSSPPHGGMHMENMENSWAGQVRIGIS